MSAQDDEVRQLANVQADLQREFGDPAVADQVERRFRETVARFDGAPIRSFVPVLAQRRVRQDLRRDVAAP